MADGKYKVRIVDGSDGTLKTITVAHADDTLTAQEFEFAASSIEGALAGGTLVTRIDMASETTVWTAS